MSFTSYKFYPNRNCMIRDRDQVSPYYVAHPPQYDTILIAGETIIETFRVDYKAMNEF